MEEDVPEADPSSPIIASWQHRVDAIEQFLSRRHSPLQRSQASASARSPWRRRLYVSPDPEPPVASHSINIAHHSDDDEQIQYVDTVSEQYLESSVPNADGETHPSETSGYRTSENSRPAPRDGSPSQMISHDSTVVIMTERTRNNNTSVRNTTVNLNERSISVSSSSEMLFDDSIIIQEHSRCDGQREPSREVSVMSAGSNRSDGVLNTDMGNDSSRQIISGSLVDYFSISIVRNVPAMDTDRSAAREVQTLESTAHVNSRDVESGRRIAIKRPAPQQDTERPSHSRACFRSEAWRGPSSSSADHLDCPSSRTSIRDLPNSVINEVPRQYFHVPEHYPTSEFETVGNSADSEAIALHSSVFAPINEAVTQALPSESISIVDPNGSHSFRPTGQNNIVNLNEASTQMIPQRDAILIPETSRLQDQVVVVSDAGSFQGTRELDAASAEAVTFHESSEPPAKCVKLDLRQNITETPSTLSEEVMQDDACTICLDSWTSSGEHRLTSLKCGHVFGHSCILRWLSGRSRDNKNCPTCKAKVAVRDLRFIYAKTLVARDTSELEECRARLELVTEEKNRTRLEVHKLELSRSSYIKKIKELEEELSKYKLRMPHIESETVDYRMALQHNIEIAQNSSCRVMAYHSRNAHLYISQLWKRSIFEGYGLRKVDCATLGPPGKFIPVHPKMIRDVAYSDPIGSLLTVSLDKTAKLVAHATDSVVMTLTADVPLWSCCWDVDRPDRLTVGGVGGNVFHYDIRQPKTCLHRIAGAEDLSPVISLASVPGGFFACRLNSLSSYSRIGEAFDCTRVTIDDGPFSSMTRDAVSQHFLLSCRPGGAVATQRHIIGYPTLRHGAVAFDIDATFLGGPKQTLMSRSTLLRVGGDSWVAAHSEAEATVNLWSAGRNCRMLSLGAQDSIVDMCPVYCGGETLLATQSQNRTRLYRLCVGARG